MNPFRSNCISHKNFITVAQNMHFYSAGTVDWGSQYFVDLNATKIQLVFFDGSNKLVLLM